jgi:hypothetical protein
VHWSDLQINQWINDALADISNYFPAQREYTLALAIGTRKYGLSSHLVNPRAILKVEYPVDEDPPAYLEYRDIHDTRGLYGDYYAVIGTPPSEIILGPDDWGVGDTVVITYLGDHDYPEEDSDTITLPDKLLELVVLFVRMAALQEQADTETQDPRVTTLIVGSLGLNASRAEREYRTKVAEYQRLLEPGSQTASWKIDAWDRVY